MFYFALQISFNSNLNPTRLKPGDDAWLLYRVGLVKKFLLSRRGRVYGWWWRVRFLYKYLSPLGFQYLYLDDDTEAEVSKMLYCIALGVVHDRIPMEDILLLFPNMRR